MFRLARLATWPLSAEPFVADALASLAWWNMDMRQVGDPDAFIQSSRHVGHVDVWQAEDRFFAFAADVRPGAELVALVTREMSRSFTVESGAAEGVRVPIRPGLGRQAIRLPSPQPWMMLVVESRQKMVSGPQIAAMSLAARGRRSSKSPSCSGTQAPNATSRESRHQQSAGERRREARYFIKRFLGTDTTTVSRVVLPEASLASTVIV